MIEPTVAFLTESDDNARKVRIGLPESEIRRIVREELELLGVYSPMASALTKTVTPQS